MTDRNLTNQAVMKVDKNEEIVGLWAAPLVPGTGIYKLVAKKRRDGSIEWAHFIHRDDGSRKVVLRGEVESKERLSLVLELANAQLKAIFGVTMSVADVSMKTLDGRPADGTVH